MTRKKKDPAPEPVEAEPEPVTEPQARPEPAPAKTLGELGFAASLHLFERPVTHVTTLTEGAIYAIDAQWQDRIERLAEAQRIDPVMLIERLLHRAWTSMPSRKRGA